jgi:hypothetical protein
MEVVDKGHVYDLNQLGGGTQRLTFIKRSGGAVHYETEWAGLQTQEVLRVLIDRTKYLNQILPCVETEDAIHYLRMALFMYEVRAWRRKQEKVNRKEGEHDDSLHPKNWREVPFSDVPFDEHEIELRPTGEDGHILL